MHDGTKSNIRKLVYERRKKVMHIRDMKKEDYEEIDRLMSQVHKLHVEGRPDLYCEAEHI